MESGRGCPYGLRVLHGKRAFLATPSAFAPNESVVNELLLLERLGPEGKGGQIAVFFIDDNFAINIKRTKSLLRDIIAAGAQVALGRADQRQSVAR